MERVDVLIVGAGAAGLATAVIATQRATRLHVVAADGAAKLGAKILVAGGGRCNVTNDHATPEDYNGNANIVRRILASFSADDSRRWFAEVGAPLHREETGKWFPEANSGRVVLQALLEACARGGARILTGARVTTVDRLDGANGFHVLAGAHEFAARHVVLATGGLSLPKSGSDGFGYTLAKALGHTVVPTTCALVPMLLEGRLHGMLSGVAHEAAVTVRGQGEKPIRHVGSLLWTHFGVSGPVVLDASRHWLRAALEKREVAASLSFLPQHHPESIDRLWLEQASAHPKLSVLGMLRGWIPARVAEALLSELSIDGSVSLAQCRREIRQQVVRALLEYPLRFCGSRGYNYAEVTAGGVPLAEIDSRTMESRVCPGLYLVGEILDVDGRIGGFNFQWAWSTAAVAGRAIAAAATRGGSS